MQNEPRHMRGFAGGLIGGGSSSASMVTDGRNDVAVTIGSSPSSTPITCWPSHVTRNLSPKNLNFSHGPMSVELVLSVLPPPFSAVRYQPSLVSSATYPS